MKRFPVLLLAVCLLPSCGSLKDNVRQGAAALEGQEVKLSWTTSVKGVPVTFSIFGVIPQGAFTGGKTPVPVQQP